jgi:hypothetical protein
MTMGLPVSDLLSLRTAALSIAANCMYSSSISPGVMFLMLRRVVEFCNFTARLLSQPPLVWRVSIVDIKIATSRNDENAEGKLRRKLCWETGR